VPSSVIGGNYGSDCYCLASTIISNDGTTHAVIAANGVYVPIGLGFVLKRVSGYGSGTRLRVRQVAMSRDHGGQVKKRKCQQAAHVR